MTERKHQNSLLLLATLGVYLGLVLAGATPQILAQAATAKQFNIKDETGQKDDLDKKPDDERSPVTTSVQIYLEDVEYFLSTLGRLQTFGKFDLGRDSFSYVHAAMQPCTAKNIAGRYTPIKFESTSEASRKPIEYFSRGMVYGYSLGDCLETNAFDGVTAVDSRFNFALDAKDFTVNVAVRKASRQNAVDLRQQLDDTLRLYRSDSNTKLRKALIENTRFVADNDQVSIVIRLPRGSLPSLLADVK